MKKISTIILSIIISTFASAAYSVEYIGKWTTHFMLNPSSDLVYTGNYVYSACIKDIRYLDIRNNSVHALDKTTGLSATDDITAMGYSKLTETIIVGYADGNIDLLDEENSVYNIDAIKKKNISGEKKINRIFVDGRYAYLACGFGIVIIDLRKEEIKESYFIGKDNSALRIFDIIIDKKNIYAATENGLFYADKDAHNLNDYNAWKKDTKVPDSNLARICVKDASTLFMLYKSQVDSLSDIFLEYVFDKKYERINNNNMHRVNSIRKIAENEFILTVQDSIGEHWRTVFMNSNKQRNNVVEYIYSAQNLDALISDDKTLYVGSDNGNILGYKYPYDNNKILWYFIDGPTSNDAFSLFAAKNEMLVCGGQYNSFYAPLYKRFSFSGKSNSGTGKWKNYRDISPQISWGRDAINAIEDPLETGHYYVSSGYMGLLEFRKGQLENIYNDSNSAIRITNGDITYRVFGLAIGKRSPGNLWMTNPLSSDGTELVVKRADGTWKGFDVTFLDNTHRQIKLMVDYWNQIWCISSANNLFVYRENGNKLDGLSIDINRGNELNASQIYDVFEDENGYVWIGTNRGVRLIETHKDIFTNPAGTTSSVECKTIPVRSGDYVIELLKNDVVTCIAMDGANRKWLGTASNGIFLVSSSGTEEILHFTAENSPLLSNYIVDIAVDDVLGEVYVATDQGLCSYMGTATAYYNESEKIITYPNPVNENYSGNIYIRNVPHNAKVKITDLSGNLIYQGQADGNQLVWNGFSLTGKRPSSGILLVFATAYDVDRGTSEKKTGKIFFIAK
jgi:hypothetical protein